MKIHLKSVHQYLKFYCIHQDQEIEVIVFSKDPVNFGVCKFFVLELLLDLKPNQYYFLWCYIHVDQGYLLMMQGTASFLLSCSCYVCLLYYSFPVLWNKHLINSFWKNHMHQVQDLCFFLFLNQIIILFFSSCERSEFFFLLFLFNLHTNPHLEFPFYPSQLPLEKNFNHKK